MLRMIAMWSMNRAIFGRCSLIWMPGTLVAIGLNGPPLAWPGLRSNVSSCEGPPLIHSRMQDLFGRAGKAAAWARSANQPETPQPSAPAADSFSQSRRDRTGADMQGLPERIVGQAASLPTQMAGWQPAL